MMRDVPNLRTRPSVYWPEVRWCALCLRVHYMRRLMPMLRLARKILVRLRPYRWVFTIAVVQVLVMGALELLKPWPLKLIVDHVLMGYPAPWPWLHSLAPRAL